MRHLITGGSGFLGNLIAKHLSSRGDEVRTIDVWEDESIPKSVNFFHGSILDRDLVSRAMKDVDIVHHTAALVPLTKSEAGFREVNVEGCRIVAEEAARAGVKCFMHTSSSAIFGAPRCPANNDSALMPLEAYGKSKLDGEKIVQKICAEAGTPLIAIRPRTIIGEGRLGIFQILFEWIKDGRNVYVIGSGENKIQFLHAQDLIDAYLFIHDLQKPGFYNVGTDRYGSLRATLTELIQHAGTRSEVKSLPESLTISTLSTLDKLNLSPLAPWHYLTYSKDFYFDMEPLLNLGWKPKYSNREMLVETYDSFIDNYSTLMSSKSKSAHRRPVKEGLLRLVKNLS